MPVSHEILKLVKRFDSQCEAYQDVIHEDAIKIGGATEAPDLCFRTGGEDRSRADAFGAPDLSRKASAK